MIWNFKNTKQIINCFVMVEDNSLEVDSEIVFQYLPFSLII